MKKVAPELDSLMWTLAEQGNERAIDEFGARHPELRGELLRRMSMVKGLRGAKSQRAELRAPIPRFIPKETRSPFAQSRGATVVVGGLVLAAIAAATFVIMTLTSPIPAPHLMLIPSHSTLANKPIESAPTVVVPPVDNTSPVVRGNQSEAAMAEEKAPVDPTKPISIRIDHSPLSTVLESMQLISGIKIVPTADSPNPMVDVDYTNLSPMRILVDLGKKYGFTAVELQDGSITITRGGLGSGLGTNSNDPNGIRSQKIGG